MYLLNLKIYIYLYPNPKPNRLPARLGMGYFEPLMGALSQVDIHIFEISSSRQIKKWVGSSFYADRTAIQSNFQKKSLYFT